jgi:Linalool dehydratase/isomerase
MSDEVTQLNPRARGWLRHLWDKATTPDDWSSSGEPHAWWDRDSTAPMCAFPRFDLGECSYALPLMSEVTPAWREVYTRIAREFCERHMTFWAAIDALVLIGEDPNVDRYPPEWQLYMPEKLRGAYAPPGWVANGNERWGLNPDPIAADGNVFFRGFFNLLLSVYGYVSGDQRYHEPFQVSGYMDRQFTWTQPELVSFISDQMADRPEGIHCENTKIWPFCVGATGLGLKAYDAVNGTRLHTPFDAWTEFAEKHYMGRDRRGDLEWFALYYDPIEQQACTFPDHTTALASLCVLPYIYPQRPEWGTWLYEQSVRKLGWSNPKARINEFLPDPRLTSIALMMAHELGDDVTEQRLRDHVEQHCEPKTFGDENDRFGYFFGWNEPHPRGQQSALLMIPEVGGRGSWLRWSSDANLAKFDAPTVEGVDYPSVGLSVARNDLDRGQLEIQTYAATPSHRGRATSVRVVQLPDVDAVRITCDGEEFTAWRPAGANAIELDLTIGDHALVVRTGYHGQRVESSAEPATTTPTLISGTGANGAVAAPSPAAIAAVASCRCC